jgi:hypothetical protein
MIASGKFSQPERLPFAGWGDQDVSQLLIQPFVNAA